MQGIYCIEHILSNRKYYGSSMNIPNRLKQHQSDLRKNMHHNIQLQRAYNKHGVDEFKFYPIEETYLNNKKELLLHEQSYLDKNIGGYNMAPANGGDCISNHPNREDIISRIAQSVNKRYATLSKEERKGIHGLPGEKNGMFGKTHTDKMKQDASVKATGNSYAKGTIRSPDYRKNASARMKGKYVGDKNPFYNKHHTEETKSIIREKNSGSGSWIKGINPALLPYTKYYIITYPNGDTKKVAGLKIISEEFNVSIENVHNTVKRMSEGKLPTRSVFVGYFIKKLI